MSCRPTTVGETEAEIGNLLAHLRGLLIGDLVGGREDVSAAIDYLAADPPQVDAALARLWCAMGMIDNAKKRL